MKKLLTYFSVLFFFVFIGSSTAQLAKDSWAFGFGGLYPKLVSTSIQPDEGGYGGFLSIQKNFSENVGLRLKAGLSSLKGSYNNPALQKFTNNLIFGNFDLLYYMSPCSPVSPYLLAGIGGTYSMFDNQAVASLDNMYDYQINLGFGAEWTVGTNWKLITELSTHTVANAVVDGAGGTIGNGVLGSNTDMYMQVSAGMLYYFSKGEDSKYCQLYDGLKLDAMPDPVDYERIENLIKKHIPKEVVKEVVVEKQVASSQHDWVLVGVNFDFGSARLKQEAYPVLFHATQVLLQNGNMKVEVAGHTDNIGSEKANQALSEKRAKAVYDYLVARGVSRDRLSYKGYGEANPIGDNKTADGRAMNRRIEFKTK